MIFVGERDLFDALTCSDDLTFFDGNALCEESFGELEAHLAAGESMLFAMPQKIALLNRLWVFEIPEETFGNVCVRACPAPLPQIKTAGAAKGYLTVRPPHHYAIHGVDEEPRMEWYPFLVDCDRFGRERGTVGLMLKHTGRSLTKGRFAGGSWYVVTAPLDAEAWDALAEAAIRYESGLRITLLQPNFPLYYPGERGSVQCEVENFSKEMQAAELQVWLIPEEGEGHEIGIRELMISGGDRQRMELDFYPGEQEQRYTLRAQLFWKDRFVYGRERDQTTRYADRSEAEALLCKQTERFPAASVSDGRLLIGGKDGFFVGTHYYPSMDFYELSYRPFHVGAARREIAAMQRTGIRICRIWCDPILDETSMRGMEALLELLAQQEIVAIVVFFTSWTRHMEVHTPSCQSRFEVADMHDESFIGLALEQMEGQEAYVMELGQRWKRFKNIIWNLTNEFSVVRHTPDEGIKQFRLWAKKIKGALRRSGARQPVILGTSCWDTGCENYRCNKEGDLVPDHNYQNTGRLEYLPFYQNSTCRGQPFFTEEYGGVWNDLDERAREYGHRLHCFLAAGNSAALNYEWGASWMADSLSGMPAYLKFRNGKLVHEQEGFTLAGRDSYANTFPMGSAGLCPWIATPEYGCACPASGYETPAMLQMKRMAQIGSELGYAPCPAPVYLLVPFETEGFQDGVGFSRKTKNLEQCLERLWEHGMEFCIWQEDCIETLPEDAEAVIYPKEEEGRPEVIGVLERLREQGTRIYLGQHGPWEDAPAPRNKGWRHIIRPVSGGRLHLFQNCSAEQPFFLGPDARVKTDGWGMLLEQDGKIVLAECKGEIQTGEFSAKSTGRMIVRTDGSPLPAADQVELLPMECGEISFPFPFEKGSVYDGAVPIFKFPPGRCISITKELLPYIIRLNKQ